jgi:hypothetical protein
MVISPTGSFSQQSDDCSIADRFDRRQRVDLLGNGVTAAVTLAAVLLGGWLTVRTQDRLWRRDHARQWRDIRLKAYGDYVTAFRQYIAFTLEPAAKIVAVPHPRRPGELMPFFDSDGRPYKERLEATKTQVLLVAESQTTLDAARRLLLHARRVAADRATHEVGQVPSETFERLWRAERSFVAAARQELGVPLVGMDHDDVEFVLDQRVG